MQILKGVVHFQARPIADLRDLVRQSAQNYDDAVAFRFKETPRAAAETKTYHAFHEEMNALGTALLDLGLGGARIAVVGENSYAWCLAHAAVINGVGVVVPLDRLLPEDELLGLLQRANVAAVLYDGAFHATMQKAAAQLPGIRRMICIRATTWKRMPDEQDPFVPATAEPTTEGAVFSHLHSLLERGESLLAAGRRTYVEAPIDRQALAALLYTSGTTSVSKAVMLSHANIAADIVGMAQMIEIPAGTRMLSILPLHHTFENTCGLYMALYVGAQIHICDGLRYIQPNMQEYGIDMLIGVPAVFESFYSKVVDTLRKTGKTRTVAIMRKLTRGLRVVGIDLRRIVFRQILAAFGGRLAIGICGAAPIDPEIIRFFDDIGVRIYQGYGLTETSPVVAGCNSKVFVPGTVGQPVGGVEVAIDNEQAGEEGEILVRGPIVMLGYHEAPEMTAEAIDPDGWFRTGDVGRIDPKTRCLSITGRIKSMIVLKSGKKVFPEEIEFLIGQFDYIKESLVWGDEDADGDVVLSAKFVVDREKLQAAGQPAPDETELRKMLDDVVKKVNAAMPSFKSIRYYVFGFQDMVKTTTLKIKRNIEIERIRNLMTRTSLRWRELTGRNIDQVAHTEPVAAEQTSMGHTDRQGRFD